MAEVVLVSLKHFECWLCDKILTHPVTIHCGHTFCKTCIVPRMARSSKCPQCRCPWNRRPKILENIVLNRAVKEIKKNLSQGYAGPGDVECDACTEKKFKAVKSCLTCMASFCMTHLQPHYKVATWKDHRLTEANANLQEKLCATHHQSLELFCVNDEKYICTMCGVTDHHGHNVLLLEKMRETEQKQLEQTLRNIRTRLDDTNKELKMTNTRLEKMKVSVKQNREKNESSFDDVIRCIQRAEKNLADEMKKLEKREEDKANEVHQQLIDEIENLKKREGEVTKLLKTKDHIHFLNTFSSLCVSSDDGDLPRYTASTKFNSQTMRTKMIQLKNNLEESVNEQIVTLTTSDPEASTSTSQPPAPQS